MPLLLGDPAAWESSAQHMALSAFVVIGHRSIESCNEKKRELAKRTTGNRNEHGFPLPIAWLCLASPLSAVYLITTS